MKYPKRREFSSRNSFIDKKHVKFRIRKISNIVKRVHGRINEALDIISMNNTVLLDMAHISYIKDYNNVTTLYQNDFLIASKILLICRIVKYISNMRSTESINVAVYTMLSAVFIFANVH
jgi:hypothetical protein